MISQQDWERRIEVQKGSIGELIIDRYHSELLKAFALSDTYLSYKPALPGRHPVDRLLISLNQSLPIIPWDLKTKPRRSEYPDTGINLRHYDKYQQLAAQHGRFLLIFLDEKVKMIYGNFLDVLQMERKRPDQPDRWLKWNYPSQWDGIVYFPLIAMKKVAAITDDESGMLKSLRNSYHDRLKEAK